MRVPVAATLVLAAVALALKFCRCDLNGEARINLVPACVNCTTDYCYNDVFEQPRNETDKLNIVCFQKESAKEATVIYLFITIVVGLLGYNYYKAWRT